MTPEQPENLQKYLPKHAQTATFKKVEERIAEGEACPRCGYDLRGIMRGHPCPECGRPTQHAGALGRGGGVIGDFDLEYLRRVRLGLWFVMAWWLMVVFAPIFLTVTHMGFITQYYLLELGMCLGIVGACYISAVSALTIAAGGRQPPWLMAVLVIGVVSLGVIITAHYEIATVKFMMGRWPVVSKWLVYSFFIILMYQVLICYQCKSLATKMGDEALGRKFWNLVWILPVCLIITFFLAMALLGSLVGFIFFCMSIVPIMAFASEIAFILFVNSLQNDFAWAIRYQYDDMERQERLRCKKGTTGVAENGKDERNTD